MKRLRRWILIADTARARIVERLGTGRNTRILEPYRFDSEMSLRRRLPCDRIVRVRGPFGIMRRAIKPECERPCTQVTRFACGLADLLRERSAKGDFDRLLIIAPPAMLRDLRAAMISTVRAKVIAEIDTDLTNAANVEVVEYLETNNLLC